MTKNRYEDVLWEKVNDHPKFLLHGGEYLEEFWPILEREFGEKEHLKVELKEEIKEVKKPLKKK